jgi:hypothetical protein
MYILTVKAPTCSVSDLSVYTNILTIIILLIIGNFLHDSHLIRWDTKLERVKSSVRTLGTQNSSMVKSVCKSLLWTIYVKNFSNVTFTTWHIQACNPKTTDHQTHTNKMNCRNLYTCFILCITVKCLNTEYPQTDIENKVNCRNLSTDLTLAQWRTSNHEH